MTQQARHMTWELEDREPPMKYLIRDHDTMFLIVDRGSPAGLVQLRSGRVHNAETEQIKIGTPIHDALDDFQTIDLSLNWSITPFEF